jgi:hypothetical protein
MQATSDIILTTLNARYMHTAFGLRYLYANLGNLQDSAEIVEFTIQEQAINIVEKLLSYHPKIISFSAYIWNINELTDVISMLREIAPEVMLIMGGPEVSHQPDVPEICDKVDYVVAGPGEKTLTELCQQLINGERPDTKFIEAEALPLEEIKLPYRYYTDEDIRNRLIYVEASRGCPFKCEFCLSALDKTAKPFPLDNFLDEMQLLLDRGVRNFKFIDRTFNLKITTSIRILEFFLDRMSDDLYLHFEVVPDNLPDKLKDVLKRFPANSLQFEIGVQTFDPEIQDLISRKQNNDKTKANIKWLREHTGAHLHTDLIFGLPGDTLVNFAGSFNQLVALNPHEIQLGILKRLRGAPLNRHNVPYQLRYNPKAPYNILTTKDIDFATMQRVNRFARFWDMIGNSGRFNNTLPMLLSDAPFDRFMQLSDSLYQQAGSTWKIALKRLFELIYVVMTDTFQIEPKLVKAQLEIDYARAKLKGLPNYEQLPTLNKSTKTGVANKRQLNHG